MTAPGKPAQGWELSEMIIKLVLSRPAAAGAANRDARSALQADTCANLRPASDEGADDIIVIAQCREQWLRF